MYINLLYLNTLIINYEKKIKKTIPFIISSKIKYLRINLTKEVNDLCSEIYKTLMEENGDNKNKWKDIQCLWTGRINTVKSPYDSKQYLDSI